MALHPFIVTTQWPEGRSSVGTLSSEHLETAISIPAEMDGPGVGTNPDEMLLGAAATCYIITFAAMLERAGIKTEKLSMESKGLVDVTNGVFTYKEIIHYPNLLLASSVTEKEEAKAMRLADKAEKSCMISRAVAGNISVSVHPAIRRFS
ncbi:OsmC family protein [Sinobaca sp. H24]|uniref:OsmC family protein n=1 Tax=Sinobaca sp. H24 TaxID=2923376 RepID=UPI0020799075|nr:OsmC family protein [Sinobaca sp. H24]